jgi:DNA polymerase III, delta'' subunit
MVFNDIVGQQNIIKSLKNAIVNGRVAHAYLFCGPDGVGKSITASIFAGTLNCRERGTDPCGVCPSCIRARDGNHPDIVHVKTQKAVIHVDEIRELQKDMVKKPYENGVKVYIIHGAEKMNDEAQNCLLKTLEEPPKHVVIILLSLSQYSLLKTVVSRCQVLKFLRAPESDVENYIKTKLGSGEEEARYIAAFSDGIVQKAEEFIQNQELKKDRDDIIQVARSLYKDDKLHALSHVEYFLSNKDKASYILDVMMSYFRDILVFRECGDEKYLINLDKKSIIIDDSGKFTYNSLNNILNCIKRTMDNIRSNVNYQLSIEMMLLSIQEG